MTTWQAPVIIGSGPSAVSLAAALIARGIKPVMLDGGLAASRPAADASGPTGSSDKTDPGAKTWFGSDFATRAHPGSTLTYSAGVTARASYAVGGLSRIWGATQAFYSDYSAWPVDSRPEAADFDAVNALVPSSTTVFDADATAGQVKGAASSGVAMRAFERHASRRWKVEPSRLAIDSRADSAHRCTFVGTCLNGCPRDAIWYAGDQVRRWVRQGLIVHSPDVIVHHLRETNDEVELHLTVAGSPSVHRARQVFLAAGALSSAAILTASGMFGSLVVRDTSTAFTAMVSPLPQRRSSEHHGLSQWWAKSPDNAFAAQVYPPDAGNVERLAARVPSPLRFRPAIAAAAGALHPVIAYLSSDVSDSLVVTSRGGQARVTTAGGGLGQQLFARYLGAFAKPLLRAGYILPVPATQFTDAGTGYHSGASISHGQLSDSWGRPRGSTRVHVVDSSVLPRIEVGSITPTVMANAARIGRTVTIEETS